MIRDRKNKDGSGIIELWLKDGNMKLGSWKYLKSSTRLEAMNKAKKREKEVEMFKHMDRED